MDSSSSSKRKRDSDSSDEVNSCKRPKNDVLLNYSFPDIGKNFVSHLKGGLTRNGFTISDHAMLDVGHDETSELLKAIQDSEIYVVVLFTNYAFSIDCLDQLVLIMDCLPKFKIKRKVFPIFFNVEPFHVRSQQGGSFMEAFKEHETNIKPERVQKWKQALKYVGQLSGLTFPNGVDEAEFILRIVEELETMQSPQDLHVTDYPVGIGSRAQELISKLRLDCKDRVLVVAVFGISGIGKTTIAKATYNRIAAKFDDSCFLADIHDQCGRRNWKVKLQKMLISYLTHNYKHPIMHSHNDGVTKIRKLIRGRKILLVLDDVDQFQQLEELGINPKWFNKGSRIIVTTRDKQSLGYIPYASYHTTLLNKRESRTLFIRLMFARNKPENMKFIEDVVSRAGGLPLVLKVWSRHFKQYKKEQWPNILEKLKRIPHGDVQKQLRLSYDSLPNRSKKLFLDIVCFFDGMDKDLVVKVLQDEDSGFFPDIEIQNLVDRSLIEINKYDLGLLSMYHAIREMGQELVRQEVVRREIEDRPGQHTRLIDIKDVLQVLRDCSGTKSVEGISLDFDKSNERITVQVEAFKKMTNLRFIRLHDYDSRLQWSFSSFSNDEMSSFSFKKLKFLDWSYFPFKSIDNIDMSNVVVIKLYSSKLEILWEGFKSLKKLRILDVSHSRSLIKTGIFAGLEKLEKLYLSYCENLEELHSSIGCLGKLVELDLGHCRKLKRFPWEMIGKLTSLVDLKLENCSNILNTLCEVPDSLFRFHHLKTIYLDGCAKLKWIPYLPPNIETVRARHCISLVKLPFNMSKLQFVKELWLENCSNLEPEGLMKVTRLRNLQNLSMINCNVTHVSSEIGNLVSLTKLDLSGNTFSSLPDNFSNLSELLEFNMINCSQLKSISNLPRSIKDIRAHNCISLMNLPANMPELQSLTELHLDGCLKLGSEGLIKVTGLMNLRQLIMKNCNVAHVSTEIGNMQSLQRIDLSENTFYSLQDNMSTLSKLEILEINHCFQLNSIPNLPPNIRRITARSCISFEKLPSNMSELQSVTELHLDNCLKLGSEGLIKVTRLSNLQVLSMRDCNVSQVSSEIKNLVSLWYLDLSGNPFSSLPDSFSNLSELSGLGMNDCTELEVLPLLPPNLKDIEASRCWSLDVMRYDSMQTAYIFRSKMLEESFFTKPLWISLSGEVVPGWSSYRNRGNVLSFVSPMQHLDNKICGVILCATIITELDDISYPYFSPTMLNKTKETSHHFSGLYFERCSMFLMFCPLNDTTLAVEAGDTVVIKFEKYSRQPSTVTRSGTQVLSCGLRLIYEGDVVDSVLVIQTPFTFTVPLEMTVAADPFYDESLYSFPFQDDESLYDKFLSKEFY